MKTAIMTLLFGASLVAGCDSTPTAPDARGTRTQAKPSEVLGLGVSWTATRLPFDPVAMNDAGVVIGVAPDVGPVRWANGVMTALQPWAPQGDNHCLGTTLKVAAISPSGTIAAKLGECVFVWNSSLAVIRSWDPSAYLYTILGVYDDGTVLGQEVSQIDGSTRAFAIAPPGAASGASPNGFVAAAVDEQGNLYGQTAAGYPARWSAAHGLSGMTVLSGLSGGTVVAAGASGDALGMEHDIVGNRLFVEWNTNGSVTTLAGLPAHPSFLNSAGRIVGYTATTTSQIGQVWTLYQGALTMLPTPDGLPLQARGVNSCGSIIASDGFGSGMLFRRTSISTSVCDQQPLIR